MRSFSHLRSRTSILLSLIALIALTGSFAFFGWGVTPTQKAQARGLAYSQLSPLQKRMLSGLLSSEYQSQGQHTTTTNGTTRSNYFPTSDDGCTQSLGNNIRVNSNCLNLADLNQQGRGQAQAEPTIAEDSFHPGNLIAGSNDYRTGDSHCYSEFSHNSGKTWTEVAVPADFSNGTNFGGADREYWEASGNTSVAWDTKGNAYLNCEVFMRGPGTTNNPDLSSAFYVFRSTGNAGASWDFMGGPAVETYTQDPAVIEDKPYMTVDNHIGSPFQDRVYVAWTHFSADGSVYIQESHSADYGKTFSKPVIVSNSNPLCVNTLGAGTLYGTCNGNEFAQPFTAPDGTLYIVYDNFNAGSNFPGDNHFQVFLSKSIDGGNSFSAPVLVGNYNEFPDCPPSQGSQNPGEEGTCLPEKGPTENAVFRTTNYPVGAIDPLNGDIIVTYGSYINKYSDSSNGCIPQGFDTADGGELYIGVKTVGACNNKILESISSNGGTSFNGTVSDPTTMPVVTDAPGQKFTDQWFHWAAFTPDGKLVVTYYDRQYGNDEITGSMDFSLSASSDFYHFATRRVTTSSMPLPTQFPDAQGNSIFYGDYTGLAVDTEAHPIWTDTRSKDLALCPGTGVIGVPPKVCTFTSVNGFPANDQIILTATEGVPTP
jgi:hypothetical protein